MTPVEILKAARELIAKPERWTRGYLARDSQGVAIGVFEPEAVCWCAMGALDKCAGGQLPPVGQAIELLNKAAGVGLADFNDSHDHAEILDLFDRAIASAQS